MSGEFSVAFGRTGAFGLFLKAMDDLYGNCIEDINFPESLLDDPMRLMPLTEMNRYFRVIEERIDDELYIVRGCSRMQLDNFEPFRTIVCSTPVFFTAMIRLTSLMRCLQSGRKVRAVIDGEMIKWCYNTKLSAPEERLQDGIVAAWTFVHLLRRYNGKDYSPLAIHLPGSRIGKQGEIEEIFGCEIIWNAKQTEVWCPSGILKQYAPIKHTLYSNVSADPLRALGYIDLPDEDDFARCVYELINYARAFGYPKLEFVAKILMVSPVTLQRRLQKENINFSEIVKYQLLYNLAPQMLSNGKSIDEIAKELGFNNPQSFSKAFKKAHDLTPKQYVDHLENYTLS